MDEFARPDQCDDARSVMELLKWRSQTGLHAAETL